jgi:hypothetical protein
VSIAVQVFEMGEIAVFTRDRRQPPEGWFQFEDVVSQAAMRSAGVIRNDHVRMPAAGDVGSVRNSRNLVPLVFLLASDFWAERRAFAAGKHAIPMMAATKDRAIVQNCEFIDEPEMTSR